MFAIFKKELQSYYRTPTGYIFMSLFLLISGIFFALGNLFSLNPRFTSFLSSILLIFLLAVPVLTMKLLSDERRQKTDQLLLTSPVKIISIVLGKYLAAFTLFVITLAVTVLYAILLSFYGKIDLWETVGAYIGFLFMGSAFIAMGLFISAATDNQVVAAIVSFCAVLFIWVIDAIQQSVPTDPVSGMVFILIISGAAVLLIFLSTKNLLITIGTGVLALIVILLIFFLNRELYLGMIGSVLAWFSLLNRYGSFTMGVMKVKDIIYYVSFSLFFVFLTVRLIEKKRWS